MSQFPNINSIELTLPTEWEEDDDLEFKSAKGGLPKSLWETYSAMANTRGGTILLGVEDDGKITGIDEPKKMKKAFWDTINNRGKVSVNLLSSEDVKEVKLDNKVILAVHIPQTERSQCPVYLNQNLLSGTYRRNHEGDYHCNEEEVSRMLSDRREESADYRILENFGMKDIDNTSLKQYRNRFGSHHPNHPWLDTDEKGLLIKLGGWRQDRKSNQEGLTVAGLLMFGSDETIREILPQYHVDYRERFSTDPAVRWTDRLTEDGTWPSNLFQFYVRVILRLFSDLKTPFALDKDLFRKGESEVHEAVREALVNSLIHADYQEQNGGGIIIEKYPDRFIFSNPGTSLVSIKKLLQGNNVSVCRNKKLQNMFTLIGAAERAGSGMDKIKKGWSSQHWRTPIFKEETRPDRVSCELPMVSLIPQESLDRLSKRFGDNFSNFNKIEIQALVTSDLEGSVDNMRMRQLTCNHATDITHVLQGLVSKGALLKEGNTRGARYRLLESQSSYSIPKTSYSIPNASYSIPNTDYSVPKASYSIPKATELESINNLENKEREALEKIAAPARAKKRLAPSEIQQIIAELCNGRWLSRRQLSELLDRNPDSLRIRLLVPMIEGGLLKLRYPEAPNRIDQAYTLVKKPT